MSQSCIEVEHVRLMVDMAFDNLTAAFEKQVKHELSPEEFPCQDCGHTRNKIGEENSEQLESIPASLLVL